MNNLLTRLFKPKRKPRASKPRGMRALLADGLLLMESDKDPLIVDWCRKVRAVLKEPAK